MITSVADLPFRERPVLELLNLAGDRDAPDEDYSGYGWARAPRVWLVDADGARSRAVDDALLLALHCPDDGERLERDVELYFELPGEGPVTVLASTFFEHWLPRLPEGTPIVLALCNPHRASLSLPASPGSAAAPRPVHFAHGEVESWLSTEDAAIELRAPSWQTVTR